ncbi:hypothetical protein AB8Q02_02630 [Enterobacter ludwigii]
MNNKTALLSLSITSFVLVIATTLGIYVSQEKQNFACQGEVTASKKGKNTQFLINFRRERAQGWFDITERNPREEHVKGKKISYSLSFHLIRADEDFLLLSDNDNQFMDFMDPGLSVPDFFLYQGRGLALKIIAINTDTYLFVDNGLPVFYCKKVK